MIRLISTAEAAMTKEAVDEVTLGDKVNELFNKPEEALDKIGGFFQGLLDSFLHSLPTILFAIVILIVGLVACKFALWLISKGLDKSKVDLTASKFLKQCIRIVLYVVLLIVVLSMLGIPTTSVITVIGTAGVAIGLALQDSLSNVAGGFVLMITKPFKIGDYIIANGVEGTVKQISIVHTRLDSGSNQAIFIPNGQAVNAVVINNSTNDTRRVDLTFSISYEDDYEKARDILLGVLESNPKVLKTPEPTVRMLQHGASAVVIATRPWCRTADYWDVYFATTEAVRAAFIENNISIPYDQLDVHVIKDK